jgi:hypothetical protein
MDIFPAVAQQCLGIPAGAYKPLPVDLQCTFEREADQVWQVTVFRTGRADEHERGACLATLVDPFLPLPG